LVVANNRLAGAAKQGSRTDELAEPRDQERYLGQLMRGVKDHRDVSGARPLMGKSSRQIVERITGGGFSG